MRLLALAASACIVLAGCGASEEDDVKQAFDDYVRAVKDRDGDAFCDLIASSELARMSKDQRAKEIDLCKDDFSAKDFAKAPDELSDADIGEIEVKGDTAKAQAAATPNDEESNFTWRFLKLDGEWKVLFESR